MITKRSLGLAICEYRFKAGLTQKDLARYSGVSLSTLQSWEQGTREPGALRLLRVVRALHLSTDDLFIRADEIRGLPR
jgi:transcriptional regulator with XRE-family HTH domain